jgi:hypothetical protein
MSTSNVIYLHDWCEWPAPRKDNFATSQETLELLKAFTRIENSSFRSAIIRAARQAASPQTEPPKHTA